MMTDLASIQALAPVRANIAALMAEYEAEHGEVQTLPIYIGERPQPAFTITVPGKQKAVKQSRALRQADHKRVLARTTHKMDKVARIRELAATGMKIADIAEQAGFNPPLTVKYVQRIILEHGLSRGRMTAGE